MAQRQKKQRDVVATSGHLGASTVGNFMRSVQVMQVFFFKAVCACVLYMCMRICVPMCVHVEARC